MNLVINLFVVLLACEELCEESWIHSVLRVYSSFVYEGLKCLLKLIKVLLSQFFLLLFKVPSFVFILIFLCFLIVLLVFWSMLIRFLILSGGFFLSVTLNHTIDHVLISTVLFIHNLRVYLAELCMRILLVAHVRMILFGQTIICSLYLFLRGIFFDT